LENKKEFVRIFKAMADETRIEILEMLSDGELCACKILESFHITQPTLSYHMRILTDCGLVEGKRDGAWTRYSLKKENFVALADLFNDFSKAIQQDNEPVCDGEC